MFSSCCLSRTIPTDRRPNCRRRHHRYECHRRPWCRLAVDSHCHHRSSWFLGQISAGRCHLLRRRLPRILELVAVAVVPLSGLIPVTFGRCLHRHRLLLFRSSVPSAVRLRRIPPLAFRRRFCEAESNDLVMESAIVDQPNLPIGWLIWFDSFRTSTTPFFLPFSNGFVVYFLNLDAYWVYGRVSMFVIRLYFLIHCIFHCIYWSLIKVSV